MKSTDFLIQEHKVILRSLDVLDAMAVVAGAGGSVDASDIYELMNFLRWFADAHHQAKEERVLFPALKSAAVSQERSVDHMMFEHTLERGLIEELEKDVRLSEWKEFEARANHLSSTLRNHIYKEDHLLFEAADSLLSPQQDNAVFDALNRFDTPLDKELIQQKLTRLHSLEWKYLRKG
jgi:hemerythrin-like domain-containing protein